MNVYKEEYHRAMTAAATDQLASQHKITTHEIYQQTETTWDHKHTSPVLRLFERANGTHTAGGSESGESSLKPKRESCVLKIIAL